MCRFIETLKIQNARAFHIELHNERLNATRKQFFGEGDEIDLSDTIENISDLDSEKTYRFTVEYGQKIEKTRIIEYTVPLIKSLKVVEDDQIDYSFKYADRSKLDSLFGKRENCDNIIIVKQGFVSDSWFANLVFYDGTSWFTPQQPLLKGTKRKFLLQQNKIQERNIRIKDFADFQKVCLINAMLDLDQCSVSINSIQSLKNIY